MAKKKTSKKKPIKKSDNSKKKASKKSASKKQTGKEGKGKKAGKKNPSAAEQKTKQTPPKKSDSESQDECVVVGVGASAGGLESFKQFLGQMPSDAGIAYVLVQHLDPTHESLMVELLSKHTSMPVLQVEDAMPVRPNHVYMIPPNRFMKVADGGLFLEEPVVKRGVRLPIDYFFRSLAEARQERAICVVLSGTGSDGSDGVREVKAAGGMTLAQKAETAEYDGMPRAAMSTGCVDFVVAIDEMADIILPYAKHPYVQSKPDSTFADSAPDHFRAILSLLRAHTNQDFSRYKKGTLTRRIERRMGIRQVAKPADYLTLLRDDSDELRALFKDLLIGVTRFFRDESAWRDLGNALSQTILERAEEEPFRVWVPGCSTGEEAFTVAMLLHEQLHRQNRRLDLQVFATDIDSQAIDAARLGVYPLNIAKDLSEERMDSFFQREGEKYRVRKKLRETCIFAAQNLLSDPPFSNLDLICCRNLLIYLEPDVQRKVFDMLHFALRPNGILFLGKSESPAKRKQLFETVSQHSRIYRKVGQSKPGGGGIPVDGAKSRNSLAAARDDEMAVMPSVGTVELSKRALLEEYAPASVVVNHQGSIQYIHGPVRNYLDFPSGEPDLDLGSMAQEGLKGKSRSALHQARSTGETVSVLAPRVRRDGGFVSVRLRVQPLPVAKGNDALFLISFLDEPSETSSSDLTASDGAERPVDHGDEFDHTDRHLALELQATREDLQSTIEELESANEELKASNEEVMSMNEELQSTNEELETSREELQSLNEELSTVNNQLHDKVGELEATTNDLQNLLASTDMATLFLDNELLIRRFTPATSRLINILESDIGRPVSDLSPRVNDPDLVPDAHEVLDQLTPVEKEVKNGGPKWFMRRIMPFRTGENKIEGVVITFSDITRIKQASNRTAFRERQQAVIAQIGRAALAGEDLETLFERATREVAQTLKVTFSKILQLDSEGRTLKLISGVGWNEGLVGEAAVPAGIGSQAGYTLQTSGPVIVQNLNEEKRFTGPQLLLDHKVIAGLSVIIGPEEAPWGVFGVHSREEVEFTIDDTYFVSSIANVLWEAIQRRNREHSLQVSESRWKFALEAGTAGAWEMDLRSQTAWTSEQHDAIFGYDASAQSWSYAKFLEHVIEEDRAQVDELFKQAIHDTQPWRFECRIRRADGQQRWIRASGRPEIHAHGADSRMWGMVEDITDRKLAETATEQARQRFQAAAEAVGSLIWTNNAVGYMEGEQPGWSKYTGQSFEEYQGYGWADAVHPDDAQSTIDAWREAVAARETFSFEHRVRGRDGKYRLFEICAVPVIDESGRIREWVGVHTDVTGERSAEQMVRRSQEQLASIIECSQDAIIGKTLDGTVTSWNPAAEQLYGYTAEEMIGQSISRIIPDDQPEELPEILSKLAAGQAIRHYETLRRCRDGSMRYVSLSISPMRNSAGEITGASAIARDVTKQKLLERRLAKAKLDAEAANEAKSAFLANMSHEIRTPMTAIIGYADVLYAQLEDHDARACLRTIKDNGAYLCDIINDILDFSKIESGKMTAHREETSLIEALTDIRSLMTVRATEKSLTLSVEFEGAIPKTCLTDTKLLRQVLVNLVGNAIKFTERGGVTVTCRCLTEAELVEFSVTDTGIGISEADCKKLFEPFEQVDNTYTRTTGGSGLGLAISKKLVELLGGELKLASEVGTGSTFSFTIATGPLGNAEWIEPDPDALRIEENDPDEALPTLTGRILTADDRRDIRYLVSTFLQSAGAQAETLKDGQQLVDAYLTSIEDDLPVDAVVVDMQMPVLDGLGATRSLRAKGYQGPVIALTANAMSSDREKCLEAGCDAVVVKPIDRKELLKTLASHMADQKAEDSQQERSEHGLSILCVDDSKATGVSQKILLERLGHQVTIAASGEQALQAAADKTPSVVILDLGLPDISGSQLLSQLKTKPDLSTCKFICLSGRQEDEVDWKQLGFDYYLQKPTQIEQVEQILRKLKP